MRASSPDHAEPHLPLSLTLTAGGHARSAGAAAHKAGPDAGFQPVMRRLCQEGLAAGQHQQQSAQQAGMAPADAWAADSSGVGNQVSQAMPQHEGVAVEAMLEADADVLDMGAAEGVRDASVQEAEQHQPPAEDKAATGQAAAAAKPWVPAHVQVRILLDTCFAIQQCQLRGYASQRQQHAWQMSSLPRLHPQPGTTIAARAGVTCRTMTSATPQHTPSPLHLRADHLSK